MIASLAWLDDPLPFFDGELEARLRGVYQVDPDVLGVLGQVVGDGNPVVAQTILVGAELLGHDGEVAQFGQGGVGVLNGDRALDLGVAAAVVHSLDDPSVVSVGEHVALDKLAAVLVLQQQGFLDRPAPVDLVAAPLGRAAAFVPEVVTFPGLVDEVDGHVGVAADVVGDAGHVVVPVGVGGDDRRPYFDVREQWPQPRRAPCQEQQAEQG